MVNRTADEVVLLKRDGSGIWPPSWRSRLVRPLVQTAEGRSAAWAGMEGNRASARASTPSTTSRRANSASRERVVLTMHHAVAVCPLRGADQVQFSYAVQR